MNAENAIKLGINSYLEYIKLQNEYKRIFESFLMSKVNLKDYDDKVSSSKLGFGKVNKTLNLKSNLNEYLNLNHFYILNNFRIEKMSKEQIIILKGDSILEKEKLIIDTYKDILKDNYNNGKYVNDVYKKNYLISTSFKGYFDNDSLVIAIYYGNNKDKYGSKEKYLENFNQKKKYLDELSSEIKLKVSKELRIKCDIIFDKIY